MPITFYYGSGSPFSWNVWLTLEHKQLPYELKLMPFRNNELKTQEYRAINPHAKVPALIDDGFVIWETLAIIEYLEERYPAYPLLPLDLQQRALARRLAAEIYSYLYPVQRRLMEQTLFRANGAGDPDEIALTLKELGQQLGYFANQIKTDYLVGGLSLADFTLYPLLALIQRLHQKQPQHGAGSFIPANMLMYMQRIEQLPFFAKTLPPHWQG